MAVTKSKSIQRERKTNSVNKDVTNLSDSSTKGRFIDLNRMLM